MPVKPNRMRLRIRETDWSDADAQVRWPIPDSRLRSTGPGFAVSKLGILIPRFRQKDEMVSL